MPLILVDNKNIGNEEWENIKDKRVGSIRVIVSSAEIKKKFPCTEFIIRFINALIERNIITEKLYIDGSKCGKYLKDLCSYIQHNKDLRTVVLHLREENDEQFTDFIGRMKGNTTVKSFTMAWAGKAFNTPFLWETLVMDSCIDKLNTTSYATHIVTSTLHRELLRRKIQNGRKKIISADASIPHYFVGDMISHLQAYKPTTIKMFCVSWVFNQNIGKMFSLLKGNPIKYLYIDSIELSTSDFEGLVDLVMHLDNLEQINFTGVKATYEQLDMLVEGVVDSYSNGVIKSINMDTDHLCEEQMRSLYTRLATRTSVCFIDLHNKNISSEYKEEVDNALDVPVEERSISVRSFSKSANKR